MALKLKQARWVVVSGDWPSLLAKVAIGFVRFPVVFLTEGDPFSKAYDDVRCIGVGAATAFAHSEGLEGIAPNGLALVLQPHLAHDAIAKLPLVFSWGACNNSHENVALQIEWGVDVVRVWPCLVCVVPSYRAHFCLWRCQIIADNIGDHTKGRKSLFLL